MARPKKTGKRVTFRPDASLRRWVEKVAKDDKVAISDVVVTALQDLRIRMEREEREKP